MNQIFAFNLGDQKNGMKHNYIQMKEGLRSIRGNYETLLQVSLFLINKTSKFRKLGKSIQKMEAFQEILLMGIQDKIYYFGGNEGRITDVEIAPGLILDQQCQKGFLKKVAEFLRADSRCLKPSQPDSSLPTSSPPESLPPMQLYWDLGEKIGQIFWDSQVEELNSILNGIPSFKKWNYNNGIANTISLKLQRNVCKTISYMYTHKIITRDALKKFLKMKKTLQIFAFNGVSISDMHGVPYDQLHSCSKAVENLNEWHSYNDRKFYEGKLRFQFLI
jgi:hypothetical protein